MVLEKFGAALQRITKSIASAIFVDQKLIDGVVKELQKSLLESDVDVELVYELSEKIRDRAKESPAKGIDKREQIINVLYEELSSLLGKEKRELKLGKEKSIKIMFVGLYGSGKTTSISKLAFYYSKQGRKVCVLGLDTHRPAAPDQLEQLAEKARVACFVNKKEKNPVNVWREFENKIKSYDIVLIDTAGRHDLDAELVKEIDSLYREIKPQEVILTLAADIGQAAHEVVKKFHEKSHVTGIFLTRMDGTARGGGTLAAASVTKAPVLFLGTGEKLQDIESFDPTTFISRLLGLGDLKTLIEKTKIALEKKDTEKLEKRLEEGKFTLTDLYEQLNAMKKMGPLGKIAELVPGFSQIKIPKNLMDVQEEKLKRWGYAIESMTPKERENPELLDSQRIARISRGSAVPSGEIRELLKQYKLVKKFFGITKDKKLGQKDIEKLARKFKISGMKI